MNRNILYLLVGGLIVATSVLGYQAYQRQHHSTGVDINVGKSGITIQKN